MTRKPVQLKGILAAVTTPFSADGSTVDEEAIGAQTERLIAAGIHGLVPCGSSGEFFSLSPDEYRRVMEAYVQAAAGRVPVVVGIGAMTTAEAIDLAQHAERVGADAIMVVAPFYEPLSLPELTTFLTDLSAAINVSIIYYNLPGATGIKLDADQIAQLGRIDGLDYLKDTSGDAVTLTDLIVNRSDSITAFNGWDTLTFMGLATGAQASVWGAAGLVPEQAVALYEALAVDADLRRGRELWRDLWGLSDALESVSNYAAGLKAGLEILGHPVGPPRAPIQPLSAEDRARIEAALASFRA